MNSKKPVVPEKTIIQSEEHRVVCINGKWHNAYRLLNGGWMACPEPLKKLTKGPSDGGSKP
jgi:hypothetical protein